MTTGPLRFIKLYIWIDLITNSGLLVYYDNQWIRRNLCFLIFFFKVIQNRSSALSRKFWSLLFPFLFLFFPVYNFHLFIYSFICLSIRVSLCWQLLKERLKLKRKMKKPFVCSSFDFHFNTTHILYTNRIKILWFLSILVSKRFFFVLFSIWFVVLATVVVTMKQIMRNSEMYSL